MQKRNHEQAKKADRFFVKCLFFVGFEADDCMKSSTNG